MMRKPIIILILISFTSASYGATTTTTFAVSAVVINQCVVAATPLIFGNYDPTVNIDTAGTNSILVTCTLSSSYTIALNGGTTSGGTIAQRQMVSSGETLDYNIYQDSAHTTLWGDGTTGSTLAGSGTGILQTYTAYGLIPKQQVIPSGTYTDTITVTLTF